MNIGSRDSSVGIVTRLWARSPEVRVEFPAEERDFPLLHDVQTDSWAHRSSYTMSTGCCFPGCKAAGA
jgi:hypothetical protein